jgi:hypothetical protein
MLARQLLQGNPFGLNKGNVAQVDQDDIGAQRRVLARERTYDSVLSLRLDQPGIQRLGHYVLHRFTVSESNVKPEERIAQL